MESRVERAAALFKNGCNCAQSIVCAYCDLAGLDESTAKCVAQAFGTGMCTMEGTCGAITGAGIILGLVNGNDKAKTVRGMREIVSAFKTRNGTVTCKVLKGIGTGEVLRACQDCVRDAAEFLEKQLV